ncbi:hypothetical protein EIN_439590 [Entamoeba invadens IP1]|uniref:Uncharacterized protein n=1 Tax=Entamoeba invadens IP1 TaxID=370355 RepID=A0A0A1TX14_ENTIV|nr:hypothetical protein EIN_439590 [Entamoeba invadens IP1]ELP83885.1 hypothetical protein EIN_439590 [Entamoeba invadens IP1]|eukprot:XP_004183231.1 hypothetical protein EIN_439590 [Entamoeba invadens IP1]
MSTLLYSNKRLEMIYLMNVSLYFEKFGDVQHFIKINKKCHQTICSLHVNPFFLSISDIFRFEKHFHPNTLNFNDCEYQNIPKRKRGTPNNVEAFLEQITSNLLRNVPNSISQIIWDRGFSHYKQFISKVESIYIDFPTENRDFEIQNFFGAETRNPHDLTQLFDHIRVLKTSPITLFLLLSQFNLKHLDCKKFPQRVELYIEERSFKMYPITSFLEMLDENIKKLKFEVVFFWKFIDDNTLYFYDNKLDGKWGNKMYFEYINVHGERSYKLWDFEMKDKITQRMKIIKKQTPFYY